MAKTNMTNLFRVHSNGKKGIEDHSNCKSVVLITPMGDHCLPSITRDTLLPLVRGRGRSGCPCQISTARKRPPPSEWNYGRAYAHHKIDRRVIGWKNAQGEITHLLQRSYKKRCQRYMIDPQKSLHLLKDRLAKL
jgi:hypothetical protein